MLYLLVGVAGAVLGILSTWVILLAKSVGALRIDTSDSDGPFIFLELAKSIEYVWGKKFVILKVNRENYISRR